VISRNNFTPEQNCHVSKITNRDILRMVKQWLEGKPVTKIAEFFQVTRQRVHQIIKKFRESERY